MKKLGYKYSFLRSILVKVVNFLQIIFFLKTDTIYSNQFSQNLQLKKKLNFDGKEIFFKTGHNRLKWRVDSFFSEEPLMIDWLKKFSPKDIFLDIGANVGTYSLPALSKGSYVIAAELDPKNSSILFENVHLNNYHNQFILLPFGIGNKDKTEIVYYRDFSEGDSLQSINRPSPIPHITRESFSTKQVVFSLDSVIEKFDLPQPNKIKIDVDGNEKMVFEGGFKTILNSKEIYLEDNGLDENKPMIKKILENGFKIENEAKSIRAVSNLEMKNILFKKN